MITDSEQREMKRFSIRKQRLYIIPQRYPRFDGSRPLSFAVYKGRKFLCYSWSLTGAWRALQIIKKGFK